MWLMLLIDIANELERIGFGNAEDDAGKTIAVGLGLLDDLIDRRHVKMLELSTKSVAHQMLGKASDKFLFAEAKRVFKLGGSAKRSTIPLPRGIDRLRTIM